MIIADDGHATVGMIVRNDAYGTGLQEDTKKALADAGIEVVVEKVYDEKAQTFDAEVDEIVAADPDAILLIAFDEGVPHPDHHGREGHRPGRQGGLRHRRQHGQRRWARPSTPAPEPRQQT